MQVKTIDWPNETAVNIRLDANFDYIVVVLLDKYALCSNFYIFTKENAKTFCSVKNTTRKDARQTINFPKSNMEKYKQFERNWWFNKF